MFTLKNVLLANATSCIVFGILLVVYPQQTAYFLSTEQPAANIYILAIGIGLVLNGLHLVATALKQNPSRSIILQFAIGDFIWVAITILLILTGTWVTSYDGILYSLAIALMVGIFGVLQIIKCPK